MNGYGERVVDLIVKDTENFSTDFGNALSQIRDQEKRITELEAENERLRRGLKIGLNGMTIFGARITATDEIQNVIRKVMREALK